ncbi:MAG: hypothetical protein COA94_03500 [Rickettsiales bacterium]|nr:MAG: hypothetical protein COA94_03500 [Rickettsiales bacterium]
MGVVNLGNIGSLVNSILLMSCISGAILFWCSPSYADHLDPTFRTNENEQTDLFEKNIPDLRSFEEQIKSDRENAIHGIGNSSEDVKMQGIEALSGKSISEVEAETERLSKIPAMELESTGRAKLLEDEILDDLWLDGSKPGNIRHKEDAKRLAKAQEGLLANMLGDLKDMGIECGQVRGNTIREPAYYLQLETISRRPDTRYEQMFCESPRREYNCRQFFNVRCTNKVSKPLQAESFATNMPVRYAPRTGILTFGWIDNLSHIGECGEVYDYNIEFDLNDLRNVTEFKLLNVSFDDHVRITVNDHQIFMAPEQGDRLELTGERSWRSRYFLVKVDESDRRYSAEYGTRHNHAPDIDIRRHLKEGSNSIKVRLIVGGGGGIWLKFRAKVAECENWGISREEQCRLK